MPKIIVTRRMPPAVEERLRASGLDVDFNEADKLFARADTIRCIDLDGPSLCRYDPVDGAAHFDGPHIRINDAPGLGIRSIRGLEPIAD